MNKFLIETVGLKISFFAIQLSDSDYRFWNDVNPESALLTYNWKNIQVTKKSTLLENTTAVAKKYPKFPSDIVKDIAGGIFEYSRIRVNDCVFAVERKIVKKLGYVSKIMMLTETEISFRIKWVYNFDSVKTDLFGVKVQIQKLSHKEILSLGKIYEDQLISAFKLLPIIDDVFIDRNDNSKGVMIEPGLIDEFEDYKEDKGGKVSLFYGTNRNIIKNKNKIKYGSEKDDLALGFCEVHIPVGHVQGELERPGKVFFWNLPENHNVHISVADVYPQTNEEFLEKFREDLKIFPNKNVLVFIHGYNTTFEDAAKRTAQISWDIPFNGISAFFSWPSEGELLPYLTDEAKARGSSKAFGEFIKLILSNEELEKLHIIAHSMGNHILTVSLNQIGREAEIIDKMKKIHQIVLAAPDIDQNEFRDVILPEFNNFGIRRTLYTSDMDHPLGWSSFGRGGLPRLGQAGENIFLASGVDTIEASNLSSPSNHSYLFENKILLSDLYYLLEFGLSPLQRRLRAVTKDNKPYWLFPK